METTQIYQVMREDEFGCPECVDWFSDKSYAENRLEELETMFPNINFWLEEGTNWIRHKCKGCDSVFSNERFDAYGITTGYWCDVCYDSDKYPYRKDEYPYWEYGERLDYDY